MHDFQQAGGDTLRLATQNFDADTLELQGSRLVGNPAPRTVLKLDEQAR